MSQRSTPTDLRRPLCAAVLIAVLSVVAAEAATRPAGRVYYTALMGLGEIGQVSYDCFRFGASDVCSLDGSICGSWSFTDGKGKETGFSFELSFLEDGDLITIDGQARVDNRGRRSSLGGAARIVGAGPEFNYSFAGREMSESRCLALLGRAPGTSVVEGSGNRLTVSREVGNFTGVTLAGAGELRIRHTGTESLTITADDNLIDFITSEVRNGELLLGTDTNIRYRSNDPIVYELTVRDLDSLTVSGVAAVDVTGIDTRLFTVNISGVAMVEAAGTATRQKVTVSGVCRYDAADLESESVVIDVSGVSSAVVRARDELRGSVSGLSTLEYFGNPAVNVTVSDTSTLRRRG